MKKKAVEILLVRAQLDGVPEKALLKSRHLVSVDLVWPRTGVAKKSAAREMVLRKGMVDFTGEPWAKRLLLREEIEDHCGFAVTVTESVSVQALKRFARLTAKAALKTGADIAEKTLVGISDVAAAPMDALATMVGDKDSPKAIAQGAADLRTLPDEGQIVVLEVPLARSSTGKPVGTLTLEIRG